MVVADERGAGCRQQTAVMRRVTSAPLVRITGAPGNAATGAAFEPGNAPGRHLRRRGGPAITNPDGPAAALVICCAPPGHQAKPWRQRRRCAGRGRQGRLGRWWRCGALASRPVGAWLCSACCSGCPSTAISRTVTCAGVARTTSQRSNPRRRGKGCGVRNGKIAVGGRKHGHARVLARCDGAGIVLPGAAGRCQGRRRRGDRRGRSLLLRGGEKLRAGLEFGGGTVVMGPPSVAA